MNTNRRDVLAAIAAGMAASLALPGALFAQGAWPNKPIRYIVPFAPGGTTDILARVVGEKLGAALGQPIVVDNRPGQGGSVGATELARALASSVSPNCASRAGSGRSCVLTWRAASGCVSTAQSSAGMDTSTGPRGGCMAR